MTQLKLLALGSKEYPMGTNKGDDPQSSGGIEIYVDNFIGELAKEEDIEIKVITRKFRETKNYERDGNVEVYRVSWIKGFYFRNLSFNFSALLHGLKLDLEVIHAHGPFATLFGLILAKIKRKPLIATPHGLALQQPQYHKFLKYILKKLERFVYSRANHVIFLSEQEKDEFRKKLEFLPDMWGVVPPGLEVKKFWVGDSRSIKDEFDLKNKIVVTFVGRLIGVKGVEIFIRALKDLREDYKALIVGDGPETKKLQNMMEEHGLRDKVTFTGWRSDIPAILAASDIFVLPSYSEGLPIALLEAMAAGKACVVTDIGLPVNSGENALVVPAGDPESLARAVETLLIDEKLREKLGRNAREEVKREYSWEKAVEGYMRIFNQLKT